MNHADSQKLIDVRRKMKDKRAADYAMMINHESWKQGSATNPYQTNQYQLNRTPVQPKAPASTGLVVPHSLPIPHLPAAGAPRVPYTYPRPPFLGPPMMGAIAYSPMGANPVTPSYARHISLPVDATFLLARTTPSISITIPFKETEHEGEKRASQKMTPTDTKVAPTLAQRLYFDATSSCKKRKKDQLGENLLPFFGEKVPLQPKTIALYIFSFLSNEETYNASLVCKSWRKLAMNEDL